MLGLGAPDPTCIFCRIIAGEAPARWEAAPDSEAVERLRLGAAPGPDGGGAACFANRLRWERVMLLVVPLGHLTQRELWAGPALAEAAKLAAEIGELRCPEGFRLLSNFGRLAHQSQPHAHLHIVSGLAVNLLRAEATGSPPARAGGPIRMERVLAPDAPWTLRFTPSEALTQACMWRSSRFVEIASAASGHAERESPAGYRLIANFLPPADSPGGGPAELYVQGGGQLGLYV